MPSAWDDCRRLLDSFEPRSREYWSEFVVTVRGHMPGSLSQLPASELRRAVRWLWVCTDRLILSQTVPALSCLSIHWTISKRIKSERESFDLSEEMRMYVDLTLEDLRDSHKIELARREQFQRKAQSYLMAVTIATSFVLGFLGLALKSQSTSDASAHIPLAVKVLLLVGVGSLVMSAFTALRVIAPTEAFDLWLQARSVNESEEQQKGRLIKLIHLNQAYSLIAAPYVRASYVGMRNGIIVVTFLLVALILADGKLW
jgi:hypothetical protein